jgi:hypothetical protein
MEKNFEQFVNDLKEPANFNAWGPALALLTVGNFKGLVNFGQNKGYSFTEAHVRAFLNGQQAKAPSPHSDAESGASAYLSKWAR